MQQRSAKVAIVGMLTCVGLGLVSLYPMSCTTATWRVGLEPGGVAVQMPVRTRAARPQIPEDQRGFRHGYADSTRFVWWLHRPGRAGRVGPTLIPLWIPLAVFGVMYAVIRCGLFARVARIDDAAYAAVQRTVIVDQPPSECTWPPTGTRVLVRLLAWWSVGVCGLGVLALWVGVRGGGGGPISGMAGLGLIYGPVMMTVGALGVGCFIRFRREPYYGRTTMQAFAGAVGVIGVWGVLMVGGWFWMATAGLGLLTMWGLRETTGRESEGKRGE